MPLLSVCNDFETKEAVAAAVQSDPKAAGTSRSPSSVLSTPRRPSIVRPSVLSFGLFSLRLAWLARLGVSLFLFLVFGRYFSFFLALADRKAVAETTNLWKETVTSGTYDAPKKTAALYAPDATLWGTVSEEVRDTPQQIYAYFVSRVFCWRLPALYVEIRCVWVVSWRICCYRPVDEIDRSAHTAVVHDGSDDLTRR